MADFGDPYAAMATNPYLSMTQAPDWKTVLANALIGVGAGISNAEGSGRGWAAGIAPGLAMGNQLTARGQANDFQQRMALANWHTQASYRKAQEEKLRAEAELKREELDLDKQAIGLFKGPQVPGTATATMGLGAGAGGIYAFPTTTAALVGTGYVTNALLNNPYMRVALINRLQRPREGMMSLPLAGVLAAQQGEGNVR